MTQDKMQQLKNVGMPVFLCYGLPQEFQVSKIDLDPSMETGPSYAVTYSNGQGGEIKVVGACQGIGDAMSGEKTLPFSNLMYGGGLIDFYPKDSDEQVDFRSRWIDNWRKGAHYCFTGKNVPENFAKIVGEGLYELE